MHGKRTGKASGIDIEYQGKLRRAPTEPLQTPLSQQSSWSAREEDDHSVLMEDRRRRRRRVAFENLAKEMLRYLNNSDDVKVGITELQERLEVPLPIGISIQQVASRREVKMAKRFLKFFFCMKKKNYVLPAGPDGRRSGKASSNWKEDVKTKSGKQMLRKRQEIFKNAIEGKLRVQRRASESLQDQIIEEIKEIEHTKTEEALQLVRKEHHLWMYQNEEEKAKRKQGARKPWKDEETIKKWPDCEEARERGKKVNGGWTLKRKRKCPKSLSCRIRWKALSWTWMAKAVVSR